MRVNCKLNRISWLSRRIIRPFNACRNGYHGKIAFVSGDAAPS